MSKQSEMALLGTIRPNDEVISDAPSNLVALCSNYREVVKLCMNLSHHRMTQGEWADYLGMAEGSLSLILNPPRGNHRKRNLDPELFNKIQMKAGNRAISQFFDMESRGLLNHQSTKTEIELLEARLAELKDAV